MSPVPVEPHHEQPRADLQLQLAPHGESFERDGASLARTSVRRDGSRITTSIDDLVPRDPDPASAFEGSWVRLRTRPAVDAGCERIRIADLFCGVGGLSVGAWEAAWSLGIVADYALAMDSDPALLARYESNLTPAIARRDPIESAVDGELGATPTDRERALVETAGRVDLLLAGPPCQGHSDLNNHTRREDHRNALYLRAARFVELFMPRHVLIENVPGVVHDRDSVVTRTRAHLEKLGYRVDAGVLRAEELGVPQRRRRYFLMGSRCHAPSLVRVEELEGRARRPVTWAIDDLGEEGDAPFTSAARHSPQNVERIEYLFEHELYELPDARRPSCHRDKKHSYRSVYGRMRPNEPAPTITVGFGSTGQGRFVHPFRPRTLTPHEAARVQTFPDWFDFGGLRRGHLQKAIGNAVPPRLARALVRELLA